MEEKVINWVTAEIKGNLSREDAYELHRWRKSDPQHEIAYVELVALLPDLLHESSTPQAPDAGDAWNRFASKLDQEQKVIQLHPTNRKQYFGIWTRIAAVLVLASGLWLFWENSRYDTITLIADQTNHESILKDGSMVTLKNGSTLEAFTNPEQAKKREVWLQGSGLFQVEKDPLHPFVIHTGGLEVEVLGTTFHISAASPDDVQEVVVLEGSVKVTNKESGKTWVLKENERVRWDPASGIGNKDVDKSGNAWAWKSGVLQFTGMELQDVIHVLDRNFEVKIVLTKLEMKECRFSSRFTNAEVNDILQSIAESFGMVLKRSPAGVYYLTGGKCQ